jgi:hypothetical protein
MFRPLVADTVFDPKQLQYQKHTSTHTNFLKIQHTVFIKLSTIFSIENPRVGGSIPPPGTTFQNNINDLIFVH